jgi:hypothetical protein
LSCSSGRYDLLSDSASQEERSRSTLIQSLLGVGRLVFDRAHRPYLSRNRDLRLSSAWSASGVDAVFAQSKISTYTRSFSFDSRLTSTFTSLKDLSCLPSSAAVPIGVLASISDVSIDDAESYLLPAVEVDAVHVEKDGHVRFTSAHLSLFLPVFDASC